MPAVKPTPEKALFDLFCELFTADELVQFITHTHGKRLARELPGAGGKLSTVAFEAAGLLGRRGLVGNDLFEALAIDAPNQREYIATAAGVCGCSLRPVEVEVGNDSPGESRSGKTSTSEVAVGSEPETGEESWHVFVSYAHADQEWVRLLVENLHRLGLNVFYDEWEISAGTVVSARIDKGLSSSAAGVVVVSTASVKRLWVQQEYVALLERATKAGMRLIPVLIEDAKMPAMLGTRRWVDFQGKRGQRYIDAVNELVAALRGESTRKKPQRGEALRAP